MKFFPLINFVASMLILLQLCTMVVTHVDYKAKYKVVTTMFHGCYNLELQPCYNLVVHPCNKVAVWDCSQLYVL